MRFFRFLLAASLIAVALAPSASAQGMGDPNPANDEWIVTSLVIEQPDLTTLDISGTVLIRKYALEGTDYETSDDIADAYQQLLQADEFAQAQGQESTRAADFVRDLEESTTTAIKDTLERNFAGATVTVEPASLDLDTLAPPAGNPYDPGVRLGVAAKVTRTAEDVGIAGLNEDAIAAVFEAGAVVSTSFSLTASPGHQVAYIISPPTSPEGLVFGAAAPEGAAQVFGGSLMVQIDNAAGTETMTQAVTADVYHPGAVQERPEAEQITTVIDIELGALEQGVTELPITTTIAAGIHAVDVGTRFPDALPESVDLPYLSAEGFARLYEAGAINDADLQAANADLETTLTDSLADVMSDVEVAEAGFTDESLAAAATPEVVPVVFAAVINGVNPLPEGAEDADLALAIGAQLAVNLDLPASADRDTVVNVRAPEGQVFAEVEGGTLSEDRTVATFDIPADPSEASIPASLKLRSADAPVYTSEDAKKGARFTAILDLQEIDISVTKAAGGDFGNLLGEVSVSVDMGVFEIPPEFKSALPADLDLQFLNADGVRLLHERGLITAAQVAELEKAFLENVTKNLRDSLQTAVEVTGGLAAGTLDAAGITKASHEKPLQLQAKATFAKPLSGGAPQTQAAIALYSMPQSFALPSVQGLPTTYKVILPKGLAVSDLNVKGGTSETGTENGRDYFVVSPEDGGQATASMNIAVTPTFVIAKFWYLLLIPLALIALGVTGFVLRRRSKKAKGD